MNDIQFHVTLGTHIEQRADFFECGARFAQIDYEIGAKNFESIDGLRWPAVQLDIRSQGRVLAAYVEVRAVTPAAVATVNRALADVRACSA